MSDLLVPPPRLNVTAVTDLHQQLQAAPGPVVRVDMREVVFLGALCLQTFISAARSLQAAGGALRLINTPDGILAQMKVMGVGPETLVEDT